MDQLSEEVSLDLEKNYVRGTYEKIAEGFSETRFKKWPKVEAFLKGLPKGSLLLDVGCGNGKYLDNNSTINIGCDLSNGLLSICKDRGFEVVNCDMMKFPFKEGIFDCIICIAALHHIVKSERRQNCLKEMLNLLCNTESSRLFVQVWSYEQELDVKNPYLNRKCTKESVEANAREIVIEESFRLPVHKNRTPFTNQDLLVPFNHRSKISSQDSSSSSILEQRCTYEQHLRYYHVFKENELNEMIKRIPNARVVESYYDKGNWCSIVSKEGF